MGINISIPISKNRQIKFAVEKAKLQTETARLEELNTRKELWKTVETLHQKRDLRTKQVCRCHEQREIGA